jgi:hypothetical protein
MRGEGAGSRRRVLTMILAVVRMKLKAERATFKYSGPVQCRDWLEKPVGAARRVFL